MDRIPLQLSLDFESDIDSPSVQRTVQEEPRTKASVVCLRQFRNSRHERSDLDTTRLYKSILDSIEHFA